MMKTVQQIQCSSVLESLTDFLEADLNPDDHDRIDAHLADCPACRRVLDELQQTIALLAQLPKHKPPRHPK